ncbi:MAG TPA: hypothetical protein VNH11_30525, partial [Pirellulales bacterium]|nr:hypothetical protein [Pirellulales bacterium]
VFAFPGSSREVALLDCWIGYMSNEQFHMVSSFQLTRSTKLPWRTRNIHDRKMGFDLPYLSARNVSVIHRGGGQFRYDG